MLIQPYLFFEGRCEEAIEFYRRAVGAEVLMQMRYSDAPPGAGPSAECGPPGGIPKDKVMHAALKIGDTQVMMSDGMCQGQPKFEGFSLSLTAKDDAEAARLFEALAAGGKVTMPLAPTFYATSFGMLEDRFGVSWMVIHPLPMA
jgi:PhnB protein